ncbi:hypothetical protein [uncultured Chitinophaga sp.]|uniref:nuclear transport factor 2 family protein n=1 Tax=uncultured Chitinophaga sp. TaxID=339340 RepID=UPI0025F9D91C|nr:hypothetical protein [uncultured Chitinophaga sp.]
MITSLSFFSDNVTFSDINTEWGKTANKTETKAAWQKFLQDFEIKSIEQVGYPDLLEYEVNGSKDVLSWWKYNLVRKSDKKAIILPIHFCDSFDEDGKIVEEISYYSESLLRK